VFRATSRVYSTCCKRVERPEIRNTSRKVAEVLRILDSSRWVEIRNTSSKVAGVLRIIFRRVIQRYGNPHFNIMDPHDRHTLHQLLDDVLLTGDPDVVARLAAYLEAVASMIPRPSAKWAA
jgi:hypothetical protein